jgi:heme/copper-type cytochrome/quinol oxidase subunit 3
MTRQTLFVLTMATSLLAGLSSPALALVFALYPLWLPEIFPRTTEVVFYGASLIVATGVLLASAVPAAIAERLGGGPDAAMRTWLAAAALLTGLGILARF